MAYEYSDYGPDDNEKEAAVKVSRPEGGKAIAVGRIKMNEAAYQAFMNDSVEIWTAARHAGTLAATGVDRVLIIAHSLNVAGIVFSYEAKDDDNTITVSCIVKTVERMRAESPALLGCGCALISIIDKLRLMDREIKIDSLGLKAN